MSRESCGKCGSDDEYDPLGAVIGLKREREEFQENNGDERHLSFSNCCENSTVENNAINTCGSQEGVLEGVSFRCAFTSAVTAVAVSDNGRWIAAATSSGAVSLWRVHIDESIKAPSNTPADHTYWAASSCEAMRTCSPSECLALLSALPAIVFVPFPAETFMNFVQHSEIHSDGPHNVGLAVGTLVFSHCNQFLFCASPDCSQFARFPVSESKVGGGSAVGVKDRTGGLISRAFYPSPALRGPSPQAFGSNPDSGLACLSSAGSSLVNLSLDPLRSVDGHQGGITAIAVLPAGRAMTPHLLVTGSRDGTARVWDIFAPGKGPLTISTVAILLSVSLPPAAVPDTLANTRAAWRHSEFGATRLAPVTAIAAVTSTCFATASNEDAAVRMWHVLRPQSTSSTDSVALAEWFLPDGEGVAALTYSPRRASFIALGTMGNIYFCPPPARGAVGKGSVVALNLRPKNSFPEGRVPAGAGPFFEIPSSGRLLVVNRHVGSTQQFMWLAPVGGADEPPSTGTHWEVLRTMCVDSSAVPQRSPAENFENSTEDVPQRAVTAAAAWWSYDEPGMKTTMEVNEDIVPNGFLVVGTRSGYVTVLCASGSEREYSTHLGGTSNGFSTNLTRWMQTVNEGVVLLRRIARREKK